MFRFKNIFFIFLFISPSIFCQQNEKENLYFNTIKTLASKKYSNQINFAKATNFYLKENFDSTLVYSQKQLIVNNKIEEVNDYCHYFRAKCFQNKKLFKEAINENLLVSKNFKYYYKNQFLAGQLYLLSIPKSINLFHRC